MGTPHDGVGDNGPHSSVGYVIFVFQFAIQLFLTLRPASYFYYVHYRKGPIKFEVSGKGFSAFAYVAAGLIDSTNIGLHIPLLFYKFEKKNLPC